MYSFGVFNDINMSNFIYSLNSTNYTTNVNDMFNEFNRLFFTAYNSNFLVKSKKRKRVKRSAWITPDLKYFLNKKFKLLKSKS